MIGPLARQEVKPEVLGIEVTRVLLVLFVGANILYMLT